MPYTPYTLQTVLQSSRIEEAIVPTPTTSTSSFFSRRATSPETQVGSPTTRYSTTRIESVGAWDSDLYCGTSDGVILHYSLEDNNSLEKTMATRLENTINLGLGKRIVERILLLPQVSKAVVLCDSTLSFFSLPFLDPIPTSFIQPIKGVACFTHDVCEEGRIGDDGTIELTVVKRRSVQIYKIGESMYLKKELPLSETAITVTRHSRMLCLADQQSYKLIDLQQSNVFTLIPTPQIPIASPTLLGSQLLPCPLVSVVRKDEFLLVSGGSDNQTIGIFVNAYGEPIRGTLQWTHYPKALCVEFPYVAALLRNHTIEVHNILDQNLLQTIVLDPSVNARGISFGHGIKVWLNDLAKKLKRQPWPEETADLELKSQLQREIIRYSTAAARILIYGRDTVLAQATTPLTVQVDQLLERDQVEEAIRLTEQARETLSSESDHADRLRSELNYSYQKLGLFLIKQGLFDDAFTLLSKGDADPRMVVQLFDGLAQSKWLQESPPVLLFKGVCGLLQEVGSIRDIVESNLKDYVSDNLAEARRTFLTNASDALDNYLCAEREKRKAKLQQHDTLCKVIDICLLKLYMIKKDDAAIYRLLQSPNDCHIEDCEKALMKSKKYYALSILYESKQMYEHVLDIWSKLHAGELVDKDFKDGLSRIKRLLTRDIDTEKLPLSVIMHYTWWLMKQNPMDGVEVFTKSPRKQDMDPDEILDKLETYGHESVRVYLEYLVQVEQSDRAEYHTRLACSYVKDVCCELNKNPVLMTTFVEQFKQSINPSKADKSKELETRTLTKSTFVSYLGLQQQHSKLARTRLVLIRMLQNSSVYYPEVLLDALTKAGPLDIEKVIVYGRLNRHKEALDTLIHDLSDFVGAETYCVTNGKSAGITPPAIINTQAATVQTLPRTSSLAASIDKPLPLAIIEDDSVSSEQWQERSALFTMLFKSYLAIKDSDLMMYRSMHLLNTQGVYLDVLEVLDIIPEEWPLDLLQDFLIRSLRRSLDDYKESQIVLGLSRGENVMV
ncbi:hypothetical protein EDC96DRAFT_521434 [Choanephora cucurbitarum]|nr:hypothetical protein EDC96DRAFT_521434 [Choanephora cucurbitarum]